MPLLGPGVTTQLSSPSFGRRVLRRVTFLVLDLVSASWLTTNDPGRSAQLSPCRKEYTKPRDRLFLDSRATRNRHSPSLSQSVACKHLKASQEVGTTLNGLRNSSLNNVPRMSHQVPILYTKLCTPPRHLSASGLRIRKLLGTISAFGTH